ncbi:MAG: hypothetical protein JSU80_01170 [Deltaproteobacteria bacterium]|nr:MAG: hypothetical protein JSU80_01170 [Deltaproteobacteria bacterium]
MDWSMILVFTGLSVFSGVIAGLGTLSIIRGLFASLMFLGFAMTILLVELGLDEILSFFLGQLIVMGSTYIYLRVMHPEILKKVKNEYIYDGPSRGCC